MKRIIITLFAACLVLSMSVFSANAAESYELIPQGATWVKTDNGGASVTVTEGEDAIVFSGSVPGTWPCAETNYTSDTVISANIDEYSLVYDFTVEGGTTNMNFYFSDGFGNSCAYTIANNTLGDVNYDAGSGDLYDGVYTGAVKLSDFVNASALYDGSKFNLDYVTEDNEIIFTGIQVYSVNGATVTIRALDIVPNEEVVYPEEPATSEEPAESSEAESVAESIEESLAESKTESVAASTAESVAESVAESTDEATDSEGLGVWLYVIIAAAVVAVVVVVVVVAKKKK